MKWLLSNDTTDDNWSCSTGARTIKASNKGDEARRNAQEQLTLFVHEFRLAHPNDRDNYLPELMRGYRGLIQGIQGYRGLITNATAGLDLNGLDADSILAAIALTNNFDFLVAQDEPSDTNPAVSSIVIRNSPPSSTISSLGSTNPSVIPTVSTESLTQSGSSTGTEGHRDAQGLLTSFVPEFRRANPNDPDGYLPGAMHWIQDNQNAQAGTNAYDIAEHIRGMIRIAATNFDFDPVSTSIVLTDNFDDES